MMDTFQNRLRDLLLKIGESPVRIDLGKTSKRIQKMLLSFLTGYKNPPEDLLGSIYPIKETEFSDIITIDRIPFCSLCEHHMVPFFGHMHISYIPQQGVLGVGRFASFIDYHSRRLQIQEHLGTEIIESLYQKIQPKAILLKIIAMHACLAMENKNRGATKLITYHFRGLEELRPSLNETLHEQFL